MDDEQLLRCYAEEGSEAAFTELVGRHLDLVHSAALRQVGGDFHRAKDVTQMVFADLARKASALSRHPFLIGWLHTSTYFAAVKLMRAERRRQAREERAQLMNDLLTGAEPEIEWSRLAPMLDSVMRELSDRDRAAVLWRFFDGQALAVLGRKLGVSESAARKRVDRALEKMHRSFSNRGIESTTAALALMLESRAVIAAPAGLRETVTASALSSAVGVSHLPWIWKFIGQAKLAAGVSGLIWIGGILGVSAVGAAAYELWLAWHANATLAQEGEAYAAQRERFQVLNHTAHARPPAAAAAKSLTVTSDPTADLQRFLAAYPQARATLLADNRYLADQIYSSFFRSAGLAPSQIERFRNLLGEYWMRKTAITPAKFSTELPLPPENQIRAILGDRAYGEFQDYGQTVYAHYWAYRVAQNSPAEPLSVGQLDGLALILVKNNPLVPPAYSFGPSSLVAIDWDTVFTQVQRLFSDSQWKAAEPILLQMQARATDSNHEN